MRQVIWTDNSFRLTFSLKHGISKFVFFLVFKIKGISVVILPKTAFVLVCLGCSKKKMCIYIYIISHRLGSLTNKHLSQFWKLRSPKSRHQQLWCLGRACFLVDTLLSSHYVHTEQKCWGSSGVSFIRALISFMRALPSWLNHLPKVPPPNISTLGTGFQHMHFEGTQTFSVEHTFSYRSLTPHSHLPFSQQVPSAKSQGHE